MESEETTNPVEPEVATEAETPEVETETPETEALDEGQSEPEEEEVEHEGQKYKIPKAVKPLVMMQADYTRKTQELAEQRRTWEAERAQQAEFAQTFRAEIGKVESLTAQKAQFDAITTDQWAQLYAQDADQYRELQTQAERIKLDLDRAKSELTQKEQAALSEANANRVKAVQEAAAVLAKEIPNWSPQYAQQLATFATSKVGVSMDELRDTTDPRMWKLIHMAYGNDQKAQNKITAQRQERVAAVTPAVSVKGAAQPTGVDDRLSTAEWMRRRNAQAAKRA